MEKTIKRSFVSKLKDKHRLIVYNDNTYEEVGFLKLTPFNILWLFGLLTLIFAGSIYMLVAYTSIRELIPGYPDSNFRRTIVMNALRIDSLENEIKMRDKYFNNLNSIITGKNPVDYTTSSADTIKSKKINFTVSEEDSILRKQIEEEEQFNLAVNRNEEASSEKIDFNKKYFISPLTGVVTNTYNTRKNHLGIDIVASPSEVIKATLEGTVIMANWTIETGYVIYIQHDNNFVSVYKHNSELLKKEGNRVQAGDAIAIIGNTGEFTTGPHLHFELWHNGKPVDPEEYIAF